MFPDTANSEKGETREPNCSAIVNRRSELAEAFLSFFTSNIIIGRRFIIAAVLRKSFSN